MLHDNNRTNRGIYSHSSKHLNRTPTYRFTYHHQPDVAQVPEGSHVVLLLASKPVGSF